MDAQLMTSELFANAVKHGAGTILLTVTVSGDVLRVEVSDQSDTRPTVGRPDASTTHGRGLHIIDDLAQAWGVESSTNGRGKTVWFTRSTA